MATAFATGSWGFVYGVSDTEKTVSGEEGNFITQETWFIRYSVWEHQQANAQLRIGDVALVDKVSWEVFTVLTQEGEKMNGKDYIDQQIWIGKYKKA